MRAEDFDELDGQDAMAMLLAGYVRNAMENFHADGNLTDGQMAELNPIIRRAIFEGLRDAASATRGRMRFEVSLLPDYWEPPSTLPPTDSDET